MLRKLYIGSAVLLLTGAFVIGGAFLFERSKTKSLETQTNQENPKKARSTASLQSRRSLEDRLQQAPDDALRGLRQGEGVVYLRDRGAGRNALLKIGIEHPELQLSPEVASNLQDVFSDYYDLFKSYEAKVAHVTKQADGSVKIEIERAPDAARQLLNSLLADVKSYYKNVPPPGLLDAIEKSYAGYTNSLGEDKVTLVVQKNNDPVHDGFDLKREFIAYDTSGQVVGRGKTNNVVLRQEIAQSPYAKLSQYFPQ